MLIVPTFVVHIIMGIFPTLDFLNSDELNWDSGSIPSIPSLSDSDALPMLPLPQTPGNEHIQALFIC